MTRQSRLLLTVGIIAVGGVAALGVIANRYSAVLKRHQTSQERIGTARVKPQRSFVLRQVDAFIKVRTAVEGAMEDGATSAEALRAVRLEALAEARILEADYLQVRELCRKWKVDGGERTPREFRLAFEQRRTELQFLNLEKGDGSI